jgi:hypothetical protein
MLERGIRFIFDAREDNYQWMGRKWLAYNNNKYPAIKDIYESMVRITIRDRKMCDDRDSTYPHYVPAAHATYKNCMNLYENMCSYVWKEHFERYLEAGV